MTRISTEHGTSVCAPSHCTPKLGLDGGSGRAPLKACNQISAEALLVLTLQDMAEGAKDTLSDLQNQIAKNNEAKSRLRGFRTALESGGCAPKVSAECLDLLKSLKIPVPQGIEAGKPLTEEQKQMLSKTLDDAISTTGDLNEELSFKLQLAMGQLTRGLEAASSVSKKFNELASSIIRNI